MTGEDALAARDAALLFLRCAWNGYDYYQFDEEIAGPVSMVKGLIADEIVKLLDFPDGLFLSIPNSVHIDSGRLREGGAQSSGLDAGFVRQQYYELLTTGRWFACFREKEVLDDFYTDPDWMSPEAYLYDLDGNGTEELIVTVTPSIAEAAFLIFTCRRSGCVPIYGNWMQGDSGLSANRAAGALALSGYHGGWGTLQVVQIWDDSFLGEYYDDGDCDNGWDWDPGRLSPDLDGDYVALQVYPVEDPDWLLTLPLP